MRSVGGFRRFDVEQLKRPRHLRSRSDQSRRKPESLLAHSASHKDEIHHEHNREQVSEPADLANGNIAGVSRVGDIHFEKSSVQGKRAGMRDVFEGEATQS